MHPPARLPLATALLALALALPGAPTRAAAATGDDHRVHALVGARVVVAPGRVLGRATVVLRDGVIEAVGEGLRPPADARVWDLAGRTVHAGFVDPYVPAATLSGEKKKEKPAVPWWDRNDPQATPQAPGGSHELAWVHPEHESFEQARLEPKAVAKLRDQGFVAAALVPDRGVFRGSSAVLSLGEGTLNRLLLRARAAQVAAFEEQDGEYPASLMGTIALLRQTLHDARWYERVQASWARRPAGRERPELNRALEALAPVVAGQLPLVVDALEDPLNVLRAAAVARELGLARVHVVATGEEYRRLDEVRAAGLPLLLPLDFPEAPKAADEDEWTLVSTERLRRWKRAPANPRWLAEAGVRFALTTARLEDPADFAARVRQAVDAGLPRERALAALTTEPAELLGLGAVLGTVERGKVASLVVLDGEPFAEGARVEAVWVDGRRYAVRDGKGPKAAEVKGAWWLELERAPFVLEVKGEGAALQATLHDAARAAKQAASCVALEEGLLVVGFRDGALVPRGGHLVLEPEGDALTGFLVRGREETPARGARMAADSGKRKAPLPPARRPLPEGGPLLSPRAVLVRGATVWTQGPEGTLEGADLLVVDGKVLAAGAGLAVPPGALVVDGAGKHVTPGLIDAHSHTAISGDVNEGTQAVTAEVRIGDVVDSEDWNLYSQLAGGLTSALLLHGSANPIGGQSQTIRLRWGAPPEGLKFEGALPGIKLALGENVKQSNWGDRHVKRYPQTRLGVEQLLRERFLAARDYLRRREEHERRLAAEPDALPPRRDLELETLAEILRGERLVHCHSYRQSELLMFLRVAEEMGFTIGTLQHVLDGYKVADAIAAHGAGASTFSDWWAYKFEVYDAIPWNGALMWDRGVVVSFNSDSNEQARRLNTEAAKAVKYGGLPEVEALKLVTLNPAMQLRIDGRVGSLEPGKDGDFVIWSGHPLSTLSRAEETWIEGRKYFDRALDAERNRELERERKALVAEAKAVAEAGGGGGRAPEAPAAHHDRSGCLDDDDGGLLAAEAWR